MHVMCVQLCICICICICRSHIKRFAHVCVHVCVCICTCDTYNCMYVLNSLQEKVTMATTPDENSWLFHELGRCHLELGNYDLAKAHGEKSLTAAQEGCDLAWQLNACVLVAQAEGNCYCSLCVCVFVCVVL